MQSFHIAWLVEFLDAVNGDRSEFKKFMLKCAYCAAGLENF